MDLVTRLCQALEMEPAEVRKLRDQATNSGTTFDRVLLTRGADEAKVLQAFSEDLRLEFREELGPTKVPKGFVDVVPLSFARANDLIAIDIEESTLVVATAHPLDIHAQDDLSAMVPSGVRFVLVPRNEIEPHSGRPYTTRQRLQFPENPL